MRAVEVLVLAIPLIAACGTTQTEQTATTLAAVPHVHAYVSVSELSTIATGADTKIPVGPFPRDVAVSRDGTKVYATVTGGDTGPGGSTSVAVISTATNTVTGTINVGATPFRLVIAHHAQRGYVTDSNGVALIDTVHNAVIGAIGDPGVHDIAITPNGKSAYVTRINTDAVTVVATATNKITRSIHVGRLPEAIAITPDGTQAWTGNDMGSTITVINTRTGTTSTITGSRAVKTVAGAPLAITFADSPTPQ